MIDSDNDGHIRAPELLAAIDWAADQLNDRGVLAKGLPGVPLQAIRDDALRTLAQSLCGLETRELTPAQVCAAEDIALAKALEDWAAAAPADSALCEAAVAAVTPVQTKLDDFFARCRLAAYDERAADMMNAPADALVALAATQLASDAAGLAALPLAKVGAGGTAPLCGDALNPAWRGAIETLAREAVAPLLGPREELSDADWDALKLRLADYIAWQSAKPDGLPEAAAGLRDLERLACYVRDLLPLANNLVAFRAFYQRSGKGMFQIGTLFLDGRSAELCVAVADAAKHLALAGQSRMCLVYCDCLRGADKRVIAAAFTAGDSDQLMVGRNGVFYDRQGNDWDATITRIVDHPISLRQAFWSPYRRLARLVAEQLQKIAASKAAAVETKLGATASGVGTVVDTAPAKPGPSAFDVGKFAGIFAAIGLAVGALGTAAAALLTGLLALRWWQMPFAMVGLMLLISGPAVIVAWFKLRGRNLGPLLDANGWAVNARAAINIPFGTALTQRATLPAGAERSVTDPFAENERPWRFYLVLAVAIFVGLGGLAALVEHVALCPRGADAAFRMWTGAVVSASVGTAAGPTCGDRRGQIGGPTGASRCPRARDGTRRQCGPHQFRRAAGADRRFGRTNHPGRPSGARLPLPLDCTGQTLLPRRHGLSSSSSLPSALEHERQQPPAATLVISPFCVARHAGFFQHHIHGEQTQPDPGQDKHREPMPRQQREAAVNHHFTQVVRVTDVTMQAVGDQSALDAQGEIFLRVGTDHQYRTDQTEGDAQTEPGRIGQRIRRL